MRRDSDAVESHGQHVANAFHLSDYFIDNTVDRLLPNETPNPDWDLVERLSRLVKIITHIELVRPMIAETAMHHAYSAQMQSACLSRQVGAAVVDKCGNVVATGTNEVPKAGGGVYGESFKPDSFEGRCGLFADPAKRYCRNTTEQNAIIDELIQSIPELSGATPERKSKLAIELRKTRIGGLLEFSRAVHAEMDALLSAARNGVPIVGTRLFVTTFPCHNCARHIVSAGVDEVQYIEPYPKSRALTLHYDSIQVEHTGWIPPSEGGDKVLFRPFSGAAPRPNLPPFLIHGDMRTASTRITG
jgi:deoxycytidylate deaminase